MKSLPPIPRIKWSLLEPGTEFTSAKKLETSGWAGKQENIVTWDGLGFAKMDGEVGGDCLEWI